MIKNKRNTISIFSKIILCSLILFSFHACSFFEDDVKDNSSESSQIQEPEQPGVVITPDDTKKTLILSFTPYFGDASRTGSRSAYPEFSKTQLAAYSYTIQSEHFSETTGTYDSTNGIINFEINSLTFSEPAEVTVYAKSSGSIVWFASTSITYPTVANPNPVELSLYFQPYASSTVKGEINLTVSTSEGFTVSCEVVNPSTSNTVISTTGSVSESTPILLSYSNSNRTCTIETNPSTKIPAGSYTAKIQIKKGEELRDYIIQTINVWPGITTNRWYLADGDKHETYTITISEDEKKYYVCGSNPTGLYNTTSGLPSDSTVQEASNSNTGSILSPLETIQAAIDKCQDGTTNYIIICDGDFTDGFNFGSYMSSSIINYTVRLVGGGNSGNVSNINSKCSISTNKNVVLENIKITSNDIGAALYLVTKAACSIILYNCEISSNSNAISMGVINNGTKIVFKGSTYIPPAAGNANKIEIKSNTSIYIDGPLDTSYDTENAVRTIGLLSIEDGVIGSQYIFVESGSGADLSKESQRFEYIDFPKVIDTNGKLVYAKDIYVASSTSTPAGSSSGNGSQSKPLNTVSAAVAKIKTAANTTNCAGDYTIHVSGTIAEDSTIILSAGTEDTATLGSFTGSTLKITGTNKATDILDGSDSHGVLEINKVNVTFENITIQNGNAGSYSGGGVSIYAGSTVILSEGSAIQKNKASSGGGIYNAGTLFICKDALIGYKATTPPADGDTAIANGGNYVTTSGGGIYNTSGTIWIGYTAANTADTSLLENHISGNFGYRGGGIYNSNGTIYFNKGNISYNKVTNNGGGINFDYSSGCNIYGGTIKGNEAAGNGGGIFIARTGLTISGGTIEGNVVTGETLSYGGAIYIDQSTGLNMKGNVYIPAGDDGKNDVYIHYTSYINIKNTLNPPEEASGITATITPNSYDTSTQYLRDDGDGTVVTANYDKFKVTPNGSTKWKVKTDGTIYIPFTVYVNNDLYTDKLDLYNALGNYTYSGIEIEIRVLEASPDDFGPASSTSDYNILRSIKNAVGATRINLIVDENANIKLPEDSSNYFKSCKKLYHVDLRGLDTSDVKIMSSMFNSICDDVHSWNGVLDIRNFDTRKVTNMNYMFGYCEYLKTIIVGDNFSLAETQSNMNNMFYYDGLLVGGQGTEYDPSNDYPSIDGGSGDPGYFTSVDQLPIQVTPENISTIFQSNWTGTKQFQITGDLTTSGYSTAIAAAIYALNDTNKYVDIDFSTIDNTNYPMAPNCSGCKNITKLTFKGGGCLEQIPRGAMYLGNDTFKNCTSLTTVKVISQLTSNLESDPAVDDRECDIYFPFEGCSALEELDLTECIMIHIHGPFLANSYPNSTIKSIKYGPAANGERRFLLSQTNRFTDETDFKIHYVANPSRWEEPLMYGENSLQKANLTVYFDMDGSTKVYDGAGTWN